MRPGDWVYGSLGKVKMRGFITYIGEIATTIECIIPVPMRIDAKNGTFWICSDDCIHPDDIPAMIDLALMTGDREWFDSLQNELKSWRSAAEFFAK